MTSSAVMLVAMLVAADPPSVQDRKIPISFLQQMMPSQGGDAIGSLGPAKQAATNAGRANATKASSGVPAVDTIVNWSGSFTAPGFDRQGNPQSVWPFTMVGNSPESGHPSFINAPLIPVILDLLLADGTIFLSFDGSSFVQPLAQSPEFEPFLYTSGVSQFNDAMFRSEFASRMKDQGWHTLLRPDPKGAHHMPVPFLTPNGTRAWFIFVDVSGTPVLAAVDFDVFVNLLFPSTVPVDNTTLIGAAELAGEMTTQDLTNFVFHDVVLFEGGNVQNCCVIGFHSVDFEPGDPSNGNRDRLFVFDWASFLDPGLFRFGFEDITPHSHEIAETFHDPLVNNATPWWESVDSFTGRGLCQNNLETGDVIEVKTSVPVYQVTMNGFVYHPQVEAQFSWFAFESPSTASNGSYSFPDPTTLTALSPHPLLPGCKPAN